MTYYKENIDLGLGISSCFTNTSSSNFFQKIGLDIFEMPKPIFWENKKIVISLLSAELAQRILKVNRNIIRYVFSLFGI